MSHLPNGSRAHWTFIPNTGARRERNRITVSPKGRVLVMDELDAVADAAEAGLGLTVSSAENVLSALREGRLVRVLDEYTVLGEGEMHSEVIIQYARKKMLPLKVRVLVDFLLQELKGRDPLDVVARAIRRSRSEVKRGLLNRLSPVAAAYQERRRSSIVFASRSRSWDLALR